MRLNVYVISKQSGKEKDGVKGGNGLNMLVNMVKEYVFGKEIYWRVELKGGSLVGMLVEKDVFFKGNKRMGLI